MNPDNENVLEEFAALIGSARSLVLATADDRGRPLASYTPFWRDAAGDCYVFVSDLSSHTRPMVEGREISVMIVEDESTAANIYARRRITFSCVPAAVPRDDPRWAAAIAGLRASAGETVAVLEQLGDFRMFRLAADGCRLVLGFGQAYRITGSVVEHINPAAGRDTRQSTEDQT